MGVMDNLKEANKMKQMADAAKKEAENIRATGRSKRGYATVTLDGEKNLKNIEFSDDAMNISPSELAKMVKEAHQTAAKEIDKLLKKQFKNSGLADMLMSK